MRIQCSSKVTGKIILPKGSGNHQSGILDDFFLKIIFIKAVLTFTYKIETEKEKKHTHTHTHIVQVEEYQAKHTHKAISAIQLPSM